MGNSTNSLERKMCCYVLRDWYFCTHFPIIIKVTKNFYIHYSEGAQMSLQFVTMAEHLVHDLQTSIPSSPCAPPVLK